MTVYFVTFESGLLIQLITAFIKHHFGSLSIPCYGKILNDLLDVTRYSMFRTTCNIREQRPCLINRFVVRLVRFIISLTRKSVLF